uniref:uncharacterized protein isoform X1 n=2 Tax=Myxine glutinosa TaxID=7769 RepID=UPI00358E206F
MGPVLLAEKVVVFAMALPHLDIFLCLFACCLFGHSLAALETSATIIASVTNGASEGEITTTNANSLTTSATPASEEKRTTSASVKDLTTSASVKDLTTTASEEKRTTSASATTSASEEKTTTSASEEKTTTTASEEETTTTVSEEETTTAVYTTQTPIKFVKRTVTSASTTTSNSTEIVTTEILDNTTVIDTNRSSSSLKPKWRQTTTHATIPTTSGSSALSNILLKDWLVVLAILVVIVVFIVMLLIISLWWRKKRRMEGAYKVAQGNDMWAGEMSAQHGDMAEQDILNKEDRVERTEEGLVNSYDRNGGDKTVQEDGEDDIEMKSSNMVFQTFLKRKNSEKHPGQKKGDVEQNKSGGTDNVDEMELESAMGSMGSNFQFLGLYTGMKDTASTDTLTSAITRDGVSIAKTEL